jgi:Na+/phosphate symporter
MAQWSKAYDTSLFGGMGSNTIADRHLEFNIFNVITFFKVKHQLETIAHTFIRLFVVNEIIV